MRAESEFTSLQKLLQDLGEEDLYSVIANSALADVKKEALLAILEAQDESDIKTPISA